MISVPRTEWPDRILAAFVTEYAEPTEYQYMPRGPAVTELQIMVRAGLIPATGKFRVATEEEKADMRLVLNELCREGLAEAIEPWGMGQGVVYRPTRKGISEAAGIPRFGRASAGAQEERMTDVKPTIFIGSSKEGLPFAKAVQANLDHVAEVTIWHQGLFGLSVGGLESLAARVPQFDFAVLVLTLDDVLFHREDIGPVARDNVLFELGLCIGALGRERTFIVRPRDQPMEIPSDLAGITPATWGDRRDGNLKAALGAACTEIENEIRKLGRRPTTR